MAKRKKSKIVVRPWCWYCEREFEDEKVLMQHQKAKHFKCHQCPRRLNTAGGLAVHIQQVHKLDPDQLPRIDNALPGRDGYEVEIFGMEGIPVPDVADYKRRKEIELGLPPGSISGSGKGLQQNKRPRIENRVFAEEELRAQLEAHKALMGAADAAPPAPTPGTAVYNAAPQSYAAQPVPAAMPPPFMPGMPPPPGLSPFPPGAPPGSMPPFPPFPPGPGMPPGPPLGFPMPPPGLLRPGLPLPPFPPGGPPGPGLPPSAPHGVSSGATPIPPGPTPPFPPTPAGMPTPPNVSSLLDGPGLTSTPTLSSKPPPSSAPPRTTLPPNPPQTNPPLKAGTVLMWPDANYSPIEKRAQEDKFRYVPQSGDEVAPEKTAPEGGSRGTKRARAEDFM